MRCKYTKLFREICSVLQIYLCFWVKFAVHCKFLSVELITLSVELITFL